MTHPVASTPFWAAVADGRLAYPRCAACRTWHSYPRPWCTRCLRAPLPLEPVPGAGTVHAVTVVHRALDPAFAERVPYAHVLVDLDPGPRVLSLVIGIDPASVRPGMAVRATLEAPGLVLFRPAG